jgi:hypothetical protein
MEGVLFYKKPNLLRINFTKPADQVLVVDGEKLVLYIPELRVIMEQRLKKRSSAGVASLASAQGLNLLKKRYSISYLTNRVPSQSLSTPSPRMAGEAPPQRWWSSSSWNGEAPMKDSGRSSFVSTINRS